MKRTLLAVLFLLFLCAKSNANNADTVHVSHYSISIDTINMTAHTLRASAELTVHAKVNGLTNLRLNLLALLADSVISQSSSLSFTDNDTILNISLPATMNVGDSIVLRVYYHGTPVTDPGGFGGFYFSGTYAYNIGVALNTQPHNFGKVWFPCVDEFTDRATYDFHINTPPGYKAFCNGTLQDSTVNGNGTLTWNWQINQTIPTYLACVATAPFYTMRRTYQGIPVQFAIMSADSNKTITYFQHFDSVLVNYIRNYGAYPFDKIGYSMVPFNAGGMEHATSIHIGTAFVTSTLTYEYIAYHELSHMWFGDKVTCDKAEEMWLNEGFAAYNENAYKAYIPSAGPAVYDSLIHALHKKVVQYVHIQDAGYYAVNNVPQAYTYAHTVYDKGAVVVSKLRRFMGDSLFHAGIRAYLNNRAWTSVNSFDLRDELQNATGINMTDYFNTIVATPGFPQVSVDSFVTTPNGGNYDVTVYTRQRQKGNSITFTLPVDFTFSDLSHDSTVQFTVNATSNSFTVTLPYSPTWVSADRYGKLCSATLAYERTITNNGTYTYPDVNASIQVIDSGSAPSLIRIEHNYVKPDDFISNPGGVRISDYRYYKVDGSFSNGLHANATFNYDGNTGAANGYLDNALIAGSATEDSLLIYYRPGPGYNWQLVNGYSINFQVSHIDKRGLITVDTLKRGEYVLGVRDYTVNIPNLEYVGNNLKVAPNPSDRVVHIAFLLNGYKGRIEVANAQGKQVYSTEVFSHQEMIDWDSYKVSSGIYFIRLIDNGKVTGLRKVVIRKK
jgi:hypothetical protein